jgi:hypothetical protein
MPQHEHSQINPIESRDVTNAIVRDMKPGRTLPGTACNACNPGPQAATSTSQARE